MSACNCLETVREKLESHHGAGSDVVLDLRTVMFTDPKAKVMKMGCVLPPLYYSYNAGRKRKKSYVTFSFCPFCGKDRK